MMFVTSANAFYVIRFLLGVFEAGFAPGLIFYLTYWYPQNRMARAITVIMLCGPIGGIFGAPLSTGTMMLLDTVGGLHGWQWMFIAGGLPSVLLGVFGLFWITDRPAEAKWLSDTDKRLLAAELKHDTAGNEPRHHSFRQVVSDPRVLLLGASYFCIICGHYTVSFWLPTILKSAGVTSTMTIGILAAIPYIAAIFAMVWWGRRSDRLGERRWHTVSMLTLSRRRVADRRAERYQPADHHHQPHGGDRRAVGRVHGILGDAVRLYEGRHGSRRRRACQHDRTVRRLRESDLNRLFQDTDGYDAGRPARHGRNSRDG